MPRRVFLIRHCQSEANRDQRLEGQGDSPLSEMGVEQARRVARFMADQEIGEATLIASHLSRARATADEIAALCGWTVSHDPRIQEGGMGWMENLSYRELAEHMAKSGLAHLSDEVHGGESLEAVAARLQAAISDVLASSEGPLVAVSHGYAIHALLSSHGHVVSLADISNGDVFELWFHDDAPTGPPKRHPLK